MQPQRRHELPDSLRRQLQRDLELQPGLQKAYRPWGDGPLRTRRTAGIQEAAMHHPTPSDRTANDINAALLTRQRMRENAQHFEPQADEAFNEA